jgi:hypothetical protein
MNKKKKIKEKIQLFVYLGFIFLCYNKLALVNSTKPSLIGVSFIINNGAEKQADTDEYKLFRNPSLNRDISQTGKMQQKYLSFFLKKQYSKFLKNLQPVNIKIYTNQKLKCIMSGIVILTTLFQNFSYYFEESTKSALPSSYLNQNEYLSDLQELKINYEDRKINTFYKNCKDKIIRNNSFPITGKNKEHLLLTQNEFTKLVKDSNFCIQTVLDIYDLILLNRVFKDIKLHDKTEEMMKRLVIMENYLNGYTVDSSPKSSVLRKIDKLLASEVIFKITKFVNNLVRCRADQEKKLKGNSDNTNLGLNKTFIEGNDNNKNLKLKKYESSSCELTMFNFYERSDIVEVISMLVKKTEIYQDIEKIINNEDVFNLLYPQYSSYMAIEVYLNDINKVYLKIIFNNENIIDIISNYLYVKPNEELLLNGKRAYFSYDEFTKSVIGRLNQNQIQDVNEIKSECKKLEEEKIELLFNKSKSK